MPTSHDGGFRVSVSKDYLVFAAAHFITFKGHRCERLHGHNYRVSVALEGGLDQGSWYVYDFGELKRLMKSLCDELDHLVLLPLENPVLLVEESDDMVTVSFQGKVRYVFPREDCALLAIPNTTVEMLAQHLATRAAEELETLGTGQLTAIEVEVEENFGQSAVYREELT
jgi:6-pyruvoyltetrahydropterin/6-carboxytetrahydropterin synthase